MKTQTDLLDRQRTLKGRITLIRFNAETKQRTNTYSDIDLIVLLNEIASSSRFNNIIHKMYVDLPHNLDTPQFLNTSFDEIAEQYELNLYL